MSADEAVLVTKLEARLGVAVSEYGCAALRGLSEAGCCARCVLDLCHVTEPSLYTLPQVRLDQCLTAAVGGVPPSSSSSMAAAAASSTESSSAATPSVPSSSSLPSSSPCVCCLGVLDEANVAVHAAFLVARLKAAEYELPDYALTVGLPSSTTLRHYSLSCWLQAEAGSGDGAAAAYSFREPLSSRGVDTAKVARGLYEAAMAPLLPTTTRPTMSSGLAVAATFTHADCLAMCRQLPGGKEGGVGGAGGKGGGKTHWQRKRKRNAVGGGGQMDSLATIRRHLGTVAKCAWAAEQSGRADRARTDTPTTAGAAGAAGAPAGTGAGATGARAAVAMLQSWGMTVPPPVPSAAAGAGGCVCTRAVVIQRDPVFFAGNYIKHRRGLSQTPWFIDGARRGTSSVSECIGDIIATDWIATEYKFHSAGREDIDVRMLGQGRPFLIELIDSRRAGPSFAKAGGGGGANATAGASLSSCMASAQELEAAVNAATDDVQVRNLSVVGPEVFQQLKDGATSKRKNYCCLVALTKPVTPAELEEKLARLVDLTVLQQTPVRVLHRRTQMVRKKVVHKMEVEYINGRYFYLKMVTSAGMYVKEFVHGDLGRTNPSVGGLLGCDADILQLDVLDLILDSHEGDAAGDDSE